MHQCPRCKSGDLRRSRARSKWEAWRKQITGKRLFRCGACRWRGWGIDEGPRFADAEREAAERAVAPDAPNLVGTLLAPEPKRRAEVNLKALDSD
jgi:hypothetical protein